MGSSKKKLSAVNRRRDRSRLSFFFVLLFFGLFIIIITLETFLSDGDKRPVVENGDKDDDYTNWDVSYENDDLPAVSSFQRSRSIVFPPRGYQLVQNKQPPTSKNSSGGNNKPNDSKVSSSTKKIRYIPIQPDWQKVAGTREKFYVYSAYFTKPHEVIRVIGATKTKTTQRVHCRLYDNDTKVYATVDGSVRTIRENWNLKFSACFIICHPPKGKIKPRYISIISSASETASATNILRIQYPDPSEKSSTVDFSVCVKPIHFNYDNVLAFVEWMEFHKLVGVSHFTFYNHTIGDKVSCLMESYGNEVDVLPWSLPLVSQKEIRTEGLFAALNDCVYRHRGASKFLILVDLDEMIVPRRTGNYTQLMEQLDTLSNKKKIGAYSIQNAFFYLQWPDDPSRFKIEGNPLAELVSKNLLMLRKTRRRARLHPYKQRSKYICDPEKIVEAGNHFVWEASPGYFTLSVPSHLAALHHYRVCEFGGEQCIKSPAVGGSPSVVDKSSHRFGQKLSIRVAEQLQRVASKCHIDITKLLKITSSSNSNANNSSTSTAATKQTM